MNLSEQINKNEKDDNEVDHSSFIIKLLRIH